MGTLDGKIAIVTGTSRGVGVGIAHELLRAGATVIGVSPDSAASHDKFKRKHDLEIALAAFGEGWIGDRIEKLAFNALPGTFTDDMWAHQYDQQSNQVESSLLTRPWTTNGPESNLYGLAPHFGCCTANFHQGWPKFTASLWMATSDRGLAATVYAPCNV